MNEVAPVSSYRSVAHLYPVERDDGIRALIQTIWVGRDRDVNNKALLYRALTSAEKNLLRERFVKLSDALEFPKNAAIKTRIAQMILGFAGGRDTTRADAMTIAVQYATVLHNLPMWAIERACGKFERGEITVNDIEGVNRAFYPSTAQIYQIAEGLCGHFYAEQRDVYAVLNGVVEHRISEEERARVKTKFADLTSELGGRLAMENPRKWFEEPLTEERLASMRARLSSEYGRKTDATVEGSA